MASSSPPPGASCSTSTCTTRTHQVSTQYIERKVRDLACPPDDPKLRPRPPDPFLYQKEQLLLARLHQVPGLLAPPPFPHQFPGGGLQQLRGLPRHPGHGLRWTPGYGDKAAPFPGPGHHLHPGFPLLGGDNISLRSVESFYIHKYQIYIDMHNIWQTTITFSFFCHYVSLSVIGMLVPKSLFSPID